MLCAKCEELQKEVYRQAVLLKEWGVNGGPPIQIANTRLNYPRYLMPGDGLQLSWCDKHGVNELVTGTVDKKIEVNRCTVYYFTDALGFKNAVAGMFGEEK